MASRRTRLVFDEQRPELIDIRAFDFESAPLQWRLF
jgi:hypothetical protein